MELTDDRQLAYGYFSQVLLPDYIEETSVSWNVVYDARGHFEEPHTNRRIGVGTIEVGNYLHAMRKPKIVEAGFADASVNVVGPSGNISGVLFCEKEGFGPLFKAVNLADRYDLMIISTKGVSVTAARQLIDEICGDNDLPLFVLHDFDVAGFIILRTLHRDTRRYQFSSTIEPIDLELRLADIAGLEREPAAATKVNESDLRGQLANNGATGDEIEVLLNERVELNALSSDQLIGMIERKLKEHGIKKVIPDADVLGEAYQAFHYSHRLKAAFEETEEELGEIQVKVPKDLGKRVRRILDKHNDLRWDDAIQIVLDGTQLDHVREAKKKDKAKAGNFADTDGG